MKNIFAITVILAFIFASGHLLNGNIQADQEPKSIKAEQIAGQPSPTIIKAKPGSRLTGSPKINSIKMVDFYLRNGQSARFIETQGPHPVAGQLIFGKLISEDKNKVIVERLVEGKIILSTYSKRDIDTRTLHITTMPEYKYYLELGEYFYSRTWDLIEDVDDFIQAIRCYEKAKQLMPNNPKIEQRLGQIKKDKQVWEKQMQSRAKLKKLEFEATIETRLKQLEQKVDKSCQQLSEGLKQLNEMVTNIKDEYGRLNRDVSWLSKELSRQLKTLTDRIEDNRDLIYRRCWYPRYYFYYRRSDKTDNN